jgi:hypothetical protein
MDHSEILAFVCGSLCLEVFTVPPPVLLPPTLTSTRRLEQDTDLVTWLVENTRFLTLVQTATGTRVYDPKDDLLYYAAPHASLSAACPVGHAFLCQTVLDTAPDGTSVPRLLVTDLVSPPIPCPIARNEALRSMGPLLPALCHIQWAGKRTALEAFVASGAVPHRVESLLGLRAPLHLVRESGIRIAALDELELPRI